MQQIWSNIKPGQVFRKDENPSVGYGHSRFMLMGWETTIILAN